MLNFNNYVGKEIVGISTIEMNQDDPHFMGYAVEFKNYEYLAFYGLTKHKNDFADRANVLIISNRKDISKIIGGKIKSIESISETEEIEIDKDEMDINSIYRIDTNKGSIEIIYIVSNEIDDADFYIEDITKIPEEFTFKKVF